MKVRLNPLVRDVFITSATQVSGFIATMVVTSLFGRLLGVLALGEYLLLRRVWAWMISVEQMGMQIALPRFVAYSAGAGESKAKWAKHFVAAAVTLASVATLLAIILNTGHNFFALLLFGDSHYASLILPLSVLLAGYAANCCVYGYFRGLMEMGRANFLALFNYCLIPIAAVIAFHRTGSTEKIVIAIGVGVGITSILFSLKIFRKHADRDSLRFGGEFSKLVTYGISRIPGDFGAGAIFALGPVIAAHYMPLAKVSPLLLGTSVLTSITLAVNPLGVILLSKISMMLVQRKEEAVRQQLQHLFNAVVELSIFVCLQVVIFADLLIMFWVGPKFLDDILVVRLVAAGIPFYLFYVSFRTAVDAGSIRPYNAYNLVLSLVAFVIMTGAGLWAFPRNYLLQAMAIVLLLATAVLALLTARTLRNLYGLRISWRSSAASVSLALVLSLASVLLRLSLGARLNVGGFLLFEVVIWGFYLWFLKWHGSEWLSFILKASFRKREMALSGVSS